MTVQENKFEAKEDKEGILERSAQIEEREGEFQKAELAIKEFRRTEMIEMETAGKEEEERVEKKRKKKFDDEVKVGKAKPEQKLKHEKKTDEKRDQTNQRTNQREVKRRLCVHYDQPNHLSTNYR